MMRDAKSRTSVLLTDEQAEALNRLAEVLGLTYHHSHASRGRLLRYVGSCASADPARLADCLRAIQPTPPE